LKLLKGVLLALLFSLLVGLAIGTALRWRLERPTDYIGELLNDNKQSQRFVARGHTGSSSRPSSDAPAVTGTTEDDNAAKMPWHTFTIAVLML
jgi:hypothetical protein